MPPPPPQADVEAESTVMDGGEVQHHHLVDGVYVVLFQGGLPKDVARLSNLEGQPLDEAKGSAQGGSQGTTEMPVSDEVEKEPQEEGEGEDDEEEEEEEEGEGCEEEEEEEEGEGGEEEDSEEEGEDDDDEDLYEVQVRIWPKQSHLVFVLFEEDNWVLTRSYNLSWSRESEKKEFISKILEDINHTGFPAIMTTMCGQLTFEGKLDLDDDVISELRPRISDFGGVPIADGGSCGVLHCFYRDSYGKDAQCAIKVIKLDEHIITLMDNTEPREVAMLSSFKDENVPAFYQAWVSAGYFSDYKFEKNDDEEDFDENLANLLFIQMEYCPSTVESILCDEGRQLTMEESWELFQKIAEVVRHIHVNGIIHRDLKPGNLFVGSNGAIKIGDFGDACWAKDYIKGQTGTPDCGTTNYAAPESKEGHITEKVDIYSIGVIFFEAFIPFGTGMGRVNALNDFKNGILPGDWEGDPDLLNKLTALSPTDRPSSTDLVEYIINKRATIRGNNSAHPGPHCNAMSASSTVQTAALAGMAPEGSQFNAKHYDSKIEKLV